MPRPMLVALPIALLAGCGGTPANQPAPAPGQPAAQAVPTAPDQPPANFSVSSPDARVDYRSGAGAAAYPDGLPQYPGSTADQSVNVTGDSARNSGRILAFRTADPAEQVIAFYADAANRAGYRTLTRMNSGPSATLILQSSTGENVSVTATRVGNFTQGSVVVAGASPAR